MVVAIVVAPCFKVIVTPAIGAFVPSSVTAPEIVAPISVKFWLAFVEPAAATTVIVSEGVTSPSA